MQDDDVIGKAYDSRLMRRLLGYLRPYWRSVLVALAAIITHSVLQLAPPYLTKLVIDTYIPAGDLGGLVHVAWIYLAVLAGSFALEYVQTWVMQLTGQRIMYDLRMQLYAHLQRLDLRFYDRNPVGRLMTRVTSDVDVLNELFTAGVVAVFGDIFTLAGIMIVMLGMDWRLALASFVVLPLIARGHAVVPRERARVLSHRACVDRAHQHVPAGEHHRDGDGAAVPPGGPERRPLRRDQCRASRRQHRLDLLLRGVLSGHRTGRRPGGLDHHLGRRPQRARRHAHARACWWRSCSTRRGSTGRSATCRRSSTCCSRRWRHPSASSRCSTRRWRWPARRRRSRPREPLQGHIVFDHVWFAYQDEDWVLRDVSFEVRPGQRLGLVGATGSGKTTIISLLLRFYDIQRGRILVDGVDIRDLDLATLRGLFGLVLQDVHLFSGTLGGNIRLGHDGPRRPGRAAGGRGRGGVGVHRGPAGRLRRAGRRARRDAVDGPEAAAVVCPRAGLQPPRPDPRRGHLQHRHRDRDRRFARRSRC